MGTAPNRRRQRPMLRAIKGEFRKQRRDRATCVYGVRLRARSRLAPRHVPRAARRARSGRTS